MVNESDSPPFSAAARIRDLAQRNERLERTVADLKATTRCLAQDLRAPLHSISGFARMLEINDAILMSQHGRRRLARILACTAEMDAAIEGILTSSAVNSREVHYGIVDVDSMVAELLGALSGLYATAEVVRAPLPEIMGDPPLVRQVFANLLENALKFSSKQPAPRVEVGCDEIDGAAVFFVRDNGIGFPPDTADLLFEPSPPLREAPFAGDGIGLSMARRFIDRHAGWITAECAGGATTFRFAFGPQGRPPLL